MLADEENESLTRVGPGTPMGNLMREYWVPAMLSSELPRPDCDPVRVLLLGEQLIGFRDSSGRVGLIRNLCPHRGTSLFLGRNEENGLRCVYHGWKFDVSGQCVDMPNEPPDSNFKTRVKAIAYPCLERGGLVWAYLGQREDPPALPSLEANLLPDGAWSVNAAMRNCNWLQALEGDLDTSHVGFLHSGASRLEDAKPGTPSFYALRDRAPRFVAVDTEYGSMYGAYRPAGPGELYWRIACFLFPFYALIPQEAGGFYVRAWVPMDDEHLLFIRMDERTGGDLPRNSSATQVLKPNTSDWFGRFQLVQEMVNDYLVDREKQRARESFTGIDGVWSQDHAVTETMGPILDRKGEHLGTSDMMIIRIRRRLLEAIRALREEGTPPPGVDDPEVYAVRSAAVVLSEDADWIEATRSIRRAEVAL